MTWILGYVLFGLILEWITTKVSGKLPLFGSILLIFGWGIYFPIAVVHATKIVLKQVGK